MQQTENISCFSFGKLPYYPIMINRPKDKIEKRKTTEYKRTEIMGGTKSSEKQDITIYDKWYPKNILRFSNAGSSVKSVHPTQKPVELLEYLIKTHTLEGQKVLDFTMGSGSTGVACLDTNRDFIGFEIDNNYFSIAQERLDLKKCLNKTE